MSGTDREERLATLRVRLKPRIVGDRLRVQIRQIVRAMAEHRAVGSQDRLQPEIALRIFGFIKTDVPNVVGQIELFRPDLLGDQDPHDWFVIRMFERVDRHLVQGVAYGVVLSARQIAVGGKRVPGAL